MRVKGIQGAYGLAILALLSLGACTTAPPPPTPTESDRSLIHSTTQEALENVATGESLAWQNPQTGHRGTVMPLETDEEREDGPCRSYQQTFTAQNTTQAAYGLACRNEDGSWETIRVTPFGALDERRYRYRDPYYYDPYYDDPYFYDPYYHPFGHPSRFHGRFGIHYGHSF